MTLYWHNFLNEKFLKCEIVPSADDDDDADDLDLDTLDNDDRDDELLSRRPLFGFFFLS